MVPMGCASTGALVPARSYQRMCALLCLASQVQFTAISTDGILKIEVPVHAMLLGPHTAGSPCWKHRRGAPGHTVAKLSPSVPYREEVLHGFDPTVLLRQTD